MPFAGPNNLFQRLKKFFHLFFTAMGKRRKSAKRKKKYIFYNNAISSANVIAMKNNDWEIMMME